MVKSIRFAQALALALALAAGALGLAAAPEPAHASVSANMNGVSVEVNVGTCPNCGSVADVHHIDNFTVERKGMTLNVSGHASGYCPFCYRTVDFGSIDTAQRVSALGCNYLAKGNIYCGEYLILLWYTAEPMPHVNKTFPAYAGTCTEPGYEAYQHCTQCGKYFDMAGARIDEPIPTEPLGHDICYVRGVPATCVLIGFKPHWECMRCRAMFLEESCITPVEPQDAAIEPEGHTVVNGTCTVCGETGLSQNGSVGPADPAPGNPGGDAATTEPAAKDPAAETAKKDAEGKAVAKTGDAAGATAAAAAFAAVAALAAARFSSKRRGMLGK